jgi:hypothetical protein
MVTASLSRECVLEIVKSAADALRAARTSAEDTRAVSDALARACATLRVAPEAFDAAIGADPELETLKNEALREALAGGTDPGPYAEISRESMSGLPGDTTKSRTESEPRRAH